MTETENARLKNQIPEQPKNDIVRSRGKYPGEAGADWSFGATAKPEADEHYGKQKLAGLSGEDKRQATCAIRPATCESRYEVKPLKLNSRHIKLLKAVQTFAASQPWSKDQTARTACRKVFSVSARVRPTRTWAGKRMPPGMGNRDVRQIQGRKIADGRTRCVRAA